MPATAMMYSYVIRHPLRVVTRYHMRESLRAYFWIPSLLALVFLIVGLVAGRRAFMHADEIMSVVTSREGYLLFAFTYYAVWASFFLSASVSLFLVSAFLMVRKKSRELSPQPRTPDRTTGSE